MQKIILASQSPRRKQLLEWAEVPFEILVKETDESFPEGLTVTEVAVHIAKNKALAIKTSEVLQNFGSLHNAPILAADTIVVLNNEIIGKPKDRADAIHILSKLSGQKHAVITGVVILHNEKEISFADTTEVEFYSFTDEQISFYVDKYQPYDKAGAYAIQEWIGVVGIKSINGDFYNVMGLPVSKVVQALNTLIG
jgi:septum formation protein